MNTIKEKIVHELKAAGYNNRQVSLRKRCGSSETDILLTIRDPAVKYSVVEEIGKNHQHVDRDEKTGEILSGGNTFIDTELSDEVRTAWSEKYLVLVKTAITELTAEDRGVSIDDRFTIFKDGPRSYKIHDQYDSWLTMSYYRPVDIAVDLYILDVEMPDKLTKAMAFKYWLKGFWADNNAWRDKNGERNMTTMGEDAALYFKCASDEGNTSLENDIFDWAVEFFEAYPKFKD